MNGWAPRRTAAAMLLAMMWATLPALAQQTTPDDDLKKEIAALKEALAAIQKDVREIKTLLQTQRQPSGPAQNVTLDLGNRPFKGEATAKLTLVEFTDYQ